MRTGHVFPTMQERYRPPYFRGIDCENVLKFIEGWGGEKVRLKGVKAEGRREKGKAEGTT